MLIMKVHIQYNYDATQLCAVLNGKLVMHWEMIIDRHGHFITDPRNFDFHPHT